MKENIHRSEALAGKILVSAHPKWRQRAHDIICMCGQDSAGFVGVAVNRQKRNLRLNTILERLGLPRGGKELHGVQVYRGGNVEADRAFVLHSSDFLLRESFPICGSMALTGSLEIFKAIISGHGPQHYLVAVGFVRWKAQQIENEIRKNNWLCVEPNQEIRKVIFSHRAESKWQKVLSTLNIEPSCLVPSCGHG